MLMILFVLPYQSVRSQSLQQQVLKGLKSEGFEEIRILKEGNDVFCTIERGLYRTPAEDFRQALRQLTDVYPDSCRFRLILLEQGQPLYQLSVDARSEKNKKPEQALSEKLQPHGEITWYNEKTYQRVKQEPVHRPVNTGLTLTIYPQIFVRNIRLDQLYEKQLNLAPTLQYSGWKGMLLTGQLIFPLFNELYHGESFIRPGFITFSQNFSMPGLNSLSFTAGNFNLYSYGLDLRWKKRFLHSRWNLGANMGLTGRSYINQWYWDHTPMDRFSWNVKVGYYLPVFQLQADLLAGQFLANDKGFRADLYRHFGEVTIGAYAGYAGGRSNGGFHFAIPLDPFKRKHNSRFRILLPASLDNEYNATAEFVYGRYYETRPDENRSVQDLPPQFINNIFFNP